MKWLLCSLLSTIHILAPGSPWIASNGLCIQKDLSPGVGYGGAPPRKRLAVVGGGTAGLSFLKVVHELKEQTHLNWEVVLFEQRDAIGGTRYAQKNRPEPPILPEKGNYPLLRTNTPHPSNTYNFPFPPNTNLYRGHTKIFQYLKRIVSHFMVEGTVRLRHKVISARWVGSSNAGHWRIGIERPITSAGFRGRLPSRLWNQQDVLNDKLREIGFENFDHLIVATGLYPFPYQGHFPGRDEWLRHRNSASSPPRDIWHSIWWKDAAPYTNRTVLIVGDAASGRDVANLVAEVYQSRLDGSDFPRDDRAIKKARLSHFTRNAVHFEDGSFETDIDCVIFTTGHELRLPFLEAGGALIHDPNAKYQIATLIHPPPHIPLTLNGRYMRPLYKHTMSLSSQFPPSALFILNLARNPPLQPTLIAQSIFATLVIADPSLVDPHRLKLLNELEEHEERIRQIGLNPEVIGHTLIDWNHDSQESNNFQESLINFLKERNVTGLPLFGSGDTYVEDWRKRNDVMPVLLVILRKWLELESHGEAETLLKRRVEEEWIELLDYMQTLNEARH